MLSKEEIKVAANKRFALWRREHLDELAKLDFGQNNERLTIEFDRFTAQVIAEAQADEDAVTENLRRRVLDGPLRQHVHDYLLAKTRNKPDANRHIDAYASGRLRLFHERLVRTGLTLCMGCQTAQEAVTLCYESGQYVSGVSDCMSTKEWFATSSVLSMLCDECRAQHTEKPMRVHAGGRMEYVWSIVHPARNDSDTPEYLSSGSMDARTGAWTPHEPEWRKIPSNTTELLGITRSHQINRLLTNDWDLPPEITVRNGAVIAYNSLAHANVTIAQAR